MVCHLWKGKQRYPAGPDFHAAMATLFAGPQLDILRLYLVFSRDLHRADSHVDTVSLSVQLKTKVCNCQMTIKLIE